MERDLGLGDYTTSQQKAAPSSSLYNRAMMGVVEQLEKTFAAQFGFAEGVATGFGRSALRLALETFAVRGGEVAVPEFICSQVVEAVHLSGAIPVFFRVEKDLSISPDEFRKALASHTKAAILAHYYETPLFAVSEFKDLCRERNVSLIEDCALSLGAQGIGNYGDAAVFSFTKTDWCYGGGLVTFARQAEAHRARAFRDAHFADDPLLAFQYGLLSRADFEANRPAYAHAQAMEGEALQRKLLPDVDNFYDAGRFDSRMTPLCARRALRLLSELDSDTRKRRAISERLFAAFGGGWSGFLHLGDNKSSSAFLPFFCPPNCTDEWIGRAASAGITLRRTWPAFQELSAGPHSQALEFLANQLLVLEIHPEMTEQELDCIVKCLSQLDSRATGAKNL